MTEMTPETLPTMPYSEGSRTCAKACMAVLLPNDAMYLWLQTYLEHTAELQSRIEALKGLVAAERELRLAETELWHGDAGENGEDKTRLRKAKLRLRAALRSEEER